MFPSTEALQTRSPVGRRHPVMATARVLLLAVAAMLWWAGGCYARFSKLNASRPVTEGFTEGYEQEGRSEVKIVKTYDKKIKESNNKGEKDVSVKVFQVSDNVNGRKEWDTKVKKTSESERKILKTLENSEKVFKNMDTNWKRFKVTDDSVKNHKQAEGETKVYKNKDSELKVYKNKEKGIKVFQLSDLGGGNKRGSKKQAVLGSDCVEGTLTGQHGWWKDAPLKYRSRRSPHRRQDSYSSSEEDGGTRSQSPRRRRPDCSGTTRAVPTTTRRISVTGRTSATRTKVTPDIFEAWTQNEDTTTPDPKDEGFVDFNSFPKTTKKLKTKVRVTLKPWSTTPSVMWTRKIFTPSFQVMKTVRPFTTASPKNPFSPTQTVPTLTWPRRFTLPDFIFKRTTLSVPTEPYINQNSYTNYHTKPIFFTIAEYSTMNRFFTQNNQFSRNGETTSSQFIRTTPRFNFNFGKFTNFNPFTTSQTTITTRKSRTTGIEQTFTTPTPETPTTIWNRNSKSAESSVDVFTETSTSPSDEVLNRGTTINMEQTRISDTIASDFSSSNKLSTITNYFSTTFSNNYSNPTQYNDALTTPSSDISLFSSVHTIIDSTDSTIIRTSNSVLPSGTERSFKTTQFETDDSTIEISHGKSTEWKKINEHDTEVSKHGEENDEESDSKSNNNNNDEEEETSTHTVIINTSKISNENKIHNPKKSDPSEPPDIRTKAIETRITSASPSIILTLTSTTNQDEEKLKNNTISNSTSSTNLQNLTSTNVNNLTSTYESNNSMNQTFNNTSYLSSNDSFEIYNVTFITNNASSVNQSNDWYLLSNNVNNASQAATNNNSILNSSTNFTNTAFNGTEVKNDAATLYNYSSIGYNNSSSFDTVKWSKNEKEVNNKEWKFNSSSSFNRDDDRTVATNRINDSALTENTANASDYFKNLTVIPLTDSRDTSNITIKTESSSSVNKTDNAIFNSSSSESNFIAASNNSFSNTVPNVTFTSLNDSNQGNNISVTSDLSSYNSNNSKGLNAFSKNTENSNLGGGAMNSTSQSSLNTNNNDMENKTLQINSSSGSTELNILNSSQNSNVSSVTSSESVSLNSTNVVLINSLNSSSNTDQNNTSWNNNALASNVSPTLTAVNLNEDSTKNPATKTYDKPTSPTKKEERDKSRKTDASFSPTVTQYNYDDNKQVTSDLLTKYFTTFKTTSVDGLKSSIPNPTDNPTFFSGGREKGFESSVSPNLFNTQTETQIVRKENTPTMVNNLVTVENSRGKVTKPGNVMTEFTNTWRSSVQDISSPTFKPFLSSDSNINMVENSSISNNFLSKAWNYTVNLINFSNSSFWNQQDSVSKNEMNSSLNWNNNGIVKNITDMDRKNTEILIKYPESESSTNYNDTTKKTDETGIKYPESGSSTNYNDTTKKTDETGIKYPESGSSTNYNDTTKKTDETGIKYPGSGSSTNYNDTTKKTDETGIKYPGSGSSTNYNDTTKKTDTTGIKYPGSGSSTNYNDTTKKTDETGIKYPGSGSSTNYNDTTKKTETGRNQTINGGVAARPGEKLTCSDVVLNNFSALIFTKKSRKMCTQKFSSMAMEKFKWNVTASSSSSSEELSLTSNEKSAKRKYSECVVDCHFTNQSLGGGSSPVDMTRLSKLLLSKMNDSLRTIIEEATRNCSKLMQDKADAVKNGQVKPPSLGTCDPKPLQVWRCVKRIVGKHCNRMKSKGKKRVQGGGGVGSILVVQEVLVNRGGGGNRRGGGYGGYGYESDEQEEGNRRKEGGKGWREEEKRTWQETRGKVDTNKPRSKDDRVIINFDTKTKVDRRNNFPSKKDDDKTKIIVVDSNKGDSGKKQMNSNDPRNISPSKKDDDKTKITVTESNKGDSGKKQMNSNDPRNNSPSKKDDDKTKITVTESNKEDSRNKQKNSNENVKPEEAWRRFSSKKSKKQ